MGECNHKASHAEQEKESDDQAMCCRGEFWEVESVAKACHSVTFSCFCCVIMNVKGDTHTENYPDKCCCTFAVIAEQEGIKITHNTNKQEKQYFILCIFI